MPRKEPQPVSIVLFHLASFNALLALPHSHGAIRELSACGVGIAFAELREFSRKRVKFSGSKPTVVDGPVAETKELIAGFWLWQVKSLDEAVEWLKRSPFQDTEIEI